MSIRFLPAADRTAQPWRNGGGVTREIATDSGRWRLSIAEIAADGPFSAFPGSRRLLTLLQGAGMRLRVDDVTHEISQLYEPFPFAGDAHTDCQLLDGPVTVFNVIAAVPFEVEIVRPQGTVLLGLLGTIAVVCLSGSLSVAAYEIGPLDAVLITDEPRTALTPIGSDSVMLTVRLP